MFSELAVLLFRGRGERRTKPVGQAYPERKTEGKSLASHILQVCLGVIA